MRFHPLGLAIPVLCAGAGALAAHDLVGEHFTLKAEDPHYTVSLLGPVLQIDLQPGGGCLIEVVDAELAGLYPVAADGCRSLGGDHPGLVRLLQAPIWRQGLTEMAGALERDGRSEAFLVMVRGLLEGSATSGSGPVEGKAGLAAGRTEPAKPVDATGLGAGGMETKSTLNVAPMGAGRLDAALRQREVPREFGRLSLATSPKALSVPTEAGLAALREGTTKVALALGPQIAETLRRTPAQARFLKDHDLAAVLQEVQDTSAVVFRKQAQAPGFVWTGGVLERFAQESAEQFKRSLGQKAPMAAMIIMGKDPDGWLKGLQQAFSREFREVVKVN